MDGECRGLLKISLVLLNRSLSVFYINIRFLPHREYSVLPLEGTIIECRLEKMFIFCWKDRMEHKNTVCGKTTDFFFCIKVGSNYHTTHK